MVTVISLPELNKQKRNRVVSKHLCNLGLWLPKVNLAMVLWLLYWGDKGGNFRYSTEMLDKFCLAARYAAAEYGYPNTLNTNRKVARVVFRELVEMGFVHKIDRKNYQINKQLIG